MWLVQEEEKEEEEEEQKEARWLGSVIGW